MFLPQALNTRAYKELAKMYEYRSNEYSSNENENINEDSHIIEHDSHNIDQVYPLIITNPINMLIFCSSYSIWFGGYTKKQIKEYLFRK